MQPFTAYARSLQRLPLASPRVAYRFRNFSFAQCRILSSALRFILVVAGRRSGKTTVAVNWLLFHAAATPGQICYFINPTLRQARETAWRMLQEQVPRELVRRVRHSDLEIDLVNGSFIRLHGPEEGGRRELL